MIWLALHAVLTIAAPAYGAVRPSALAVGQEIPPATGAASNPVSLDQGPEDHLTDEARETLALVQWVLDEEGRDGARQLLHETIASLEEPASGEEQHHIWFLLELDRLAVMLGSLEESKRLRESVLGLREKLLPADRPEVLAAKNSVALAMYALKDFAGAHALQEDVLEVISPDHPGLLTVKLNLAQTRRGLGDSAGARALEEEVLEVWTRLLPPDHPDLLRAKLSFASSIAELGDLAGAKVLEEEVLATRTRLLPPDHPDLLSAKEDLAITKLELGDLAGARALEEEVLAARTRLLPPDHPDLLATKNSLAMTRYRLGDLAGAHAAFEEVLAARTRLPADHPDLLQAKTNLAATKEELGDSEGARALDEEVLEVWTRFLPPDDRKLLGLKNNLAIARYSLGDLHGAHALFEEVLEAQTCLLPADHPDLLMAKQNLAGTKAALGEFASARTLDEEVFKARTRLLSADHLDLLMAKQNLAGTKAALGEFASACALQEEVLAACTRLLTSDHPVLLGAKLSLGETRHRLGDFAGANALFEEVLEDRLPLLPPDHSDLFIAMGNLAAARYALGDLTGAREVVSNLLDGMGVRARALRSEAARPAREGARSELQRLFKALSSDKRANPEEATLDAEFFATLESLRLASVASSEAAHALHEHPELAESRRELAELRSRLNDLVAAGAADRSQVEEWRKELLRLAGERDRAERELRSKLAEAGVFAGEIDGASVGAKLTSDAAAVSFLRYPRSLESDAATGNRPPGVDSLLAFVVRPDGTVRRLELGPAAELEELVRNWRASVGKPIDRGIAADRDDERTEADIARALRARILDPLLAAAGEDVRELHVVLDDFLHLLPLDALTLDGEQRVGERFAIHAEPTLARLLAAERPLAPGGTLVTVGGIDFESEPSLVKEARLEEDASTASPSEVSAIPSPLLDAATPPIDRSGKPEHFEPLRQTRYETEDVGEQYREAFESEAITLTGVGATKVALFAAAPKARWLHLATHGWFAPESFRSQLDTLAGHGSRERWQRAQETLIGFAPETLCGLALAGANRGRDAVGRVPGILTAEELATFDLRNCELAVLSACETNVGIRRAGQGIQSLQTALHAAGARTAITSLWKVDDAATRRLFELFYTKLWKEKLGKSDALWQAKMALRAEGHPPRDWAGWVLSGDPD